ncbi:MAG TPA: hypothetical protein EYN96_12535 [Candidatus Hydrogenedentes bacterium]|nr:hypothetical protein [Candidatus Hydrogenedentota bacterium]
MSDLQKKLASLSNVQGLMTGAQWKNKPAEEIKTVQSGGYEIDACVPGEVITIEEDEFYLVRTDFPIDTQHGDLTLADGLKVEGRHISLSANDEELADFDPRTAVFVDTETTGLMGGTGTVAFLIGVGYFVDEFFRLDQCFMRDYDDEEGMLNYLDDLFKKADTIVSFNGKSFDLPLMRTRFITNRIPYRLEGKTHFDLVHASRRFWKQRLRDCSLGNIEKEIMGIHRHGDVPGHEIPQIWLNYLYSRDARKLKGVFYHHQMDILSLAVLTGHMSQCIDVADGQGFEHHEDRLSLLRLHYKQKKYDEVLQLSKNLLDTLTQTGLRHECLHIFALSAKRREQWPLMEDLWKQCLTEFPRDLTARLELAKHYEHRAKDLPKAQKLCQDALTYIQTRQQLGTLHQADQQKTSFEHRLARIQKKLGA